MPSWRLSPLTILTLFMGGTLRGRSLSGSCS
ncbi:hypothetical protein PIIN_11454 [Serendipita indica DSM 11827]|uniref:Uncharacterized protein n=1 Tax=Serendipita indica (strain DSM 11827) TaxID=1109443 RepID=G4U1N4_SERID|nr:hypothetical protein PIIN_11454 [Serendipita indica DSM 11827]